MPSALKWQDSLVHLVSTDGPSGITLSFATDKSYMVSSLIHELIVDLKAQVAAHDLLRDLFGILPTLHIHINHFNLCPMNRYPNASCVCVCVGGATRRATHRGSHGRSR